MAANQATQAAETVRSRTAEAVFVAERIESGVQRVEEVLVQVGDREKQCAVRVEKWTNQARAELERLLLEQTRSAAWEAAAATHRWVEEALEQVRKDGRDLRADIGEVAKSATLAGRCEQKLHELQTRFESFTLDAVGTLTEFGTDLQELSRQQVLAPSPAEVVIPGQRELRLALAEEQKVRDEDLHRLQQRLREYTGQRSTELAVARKPAGTSARTTPLAAALQGCDAAISSLDRRISVLEDLWEQRMQLQEERERSRSSSKQKVSRRSSSMQPTHPFRCSVMHGTSRCVA